MFIAALYTIAKTWKQPKCPVLGSEITAINEETSLPAFEGCQSSGGGWKEGRKGQIIMVENWLQKCPEGNTPRSEGRIAGKLMEREQQGFQRVPERQSQRGF
ncbi:hypothetical protein Cadr_000000318 [Camelus dromedarius]|uniref:Uncharacterized protein n=1 Tax=Camelus dromedarius TaxID=9838 RepID=A0A5N4EJV3_CAMDR|nr:hypothetical protein Cadr_000000318 [Camelus dromedarius]